MAGERRINWGADATDARYRTEDTGDGANFVVAEDLDGSTVLLEYDDSATPSEWKFRGPVEMNGNDISGVGTVTASAVNTSSLEIGGVPVAPGPQKSDTAQTFNESDLTLSTTDTQVANGSIELLKEFREDFEDGDIDASNNSQFTGWNGDTGSLSAQTNTVLAGTTSGKLNESGGNVKGVEVGFSEDATGEISGLIQADRQSSSGDTKTGFMGLNENGNRSVGLRLRDDGKVRDVGRNTSIGDWAKDTLYKARAYNIDYNNNEYDVELVRQSDTTQVAQASNLSMKNNATGLTAIQYKADGQSSNSAINVYLDNVEKGATTTTTSGSATLEWSYPTDLFEWLTATYTRTLDNETVDVFVAYSDDGGATWSRTNGGNAIGRQYDLKNDSNISDSSEVRIEVEISRQDTSNNPTLDSAYRTWQI